MTAAMLAMMSFGASAYAGSASADLTVSVTVASTCSIATAGLGFGVYDPLAGSQVDASAAVSVACTKGATAAVTLGQGEHAVAGSSDAQPLRRMTSGTAYLSYALYSDAVRTAPWGNTAATGKAYLAASSVPAQLTVYGRIAASQDVPSGVFSDVVVATIQF